MKKQINPLVAILIVAVAVVGAWVVWNRLPIGPTAPPVAKGENRPPPGTRSMKNIPPPDAKDSKQAKGDTSGDKSAPDSKG